MRVTVVGAGIVGLATAYTLVAAGVTVRCLDAGAPMGGRSVGDTRIFRVAHGDPELVTEARRASELWDEWSMRAGRTLVGAERLVVSGPRVPAWADAMAAAGAVHRVDRRGDLHDPAGGVLDLVAAGAFLTAATRPERASVTGVDADGTVHLDDGSDVRADAVVVAAGADTPALVAPLGVAVPDELEHHARFTFAGPADRPCHLDGREDGPLASTYQHRTRAGHWAVGGHLPEADTAFDLGADEVARRSREAVVDHVRRNLPHLHPEPVEELRCTPGRLGDGVHRARAGAVHVVWGDNLAKMAPRVGALVAADVVGDTPVPAGEGDHAP
ncbi:FAD-dependent oxidoreductase [Actinomycetospora cinnamomea]|uniref:Glycine/D-amino acid oxidase-like deaminating enzyme n=1 Tax=Actinomycetospora cinnamomea TaxID=663609 RepID=A0A2U1FIC3_9PSEU|nr:FAD-dependent oxidoreductase [Actinomycetospora cinnamomea]PVZ11918.1 glycine/D-amino acid oxidase-like deaminating enzyme [Actinomycetospora cinnamomea]